MEGILFAVVITFKMCIYIETNLKFNCDTDFKEYV